MNVSERLRGFAFLQLTKLDERLHHFARNYIRPKAAEELPEEKMDDRLIEYPFAIRCLKNGSGRVLDVGSSPRVNQLHTTLMALGFDVYGVDRQEKKYDFPGFHYYEADIKQGLPFSDDYFDYVTCISTLEHVGLGGGRYGENKDEEGDKKAVIEMFRVLKPNGKLIITVPFGKYHEFKPYSRVYDKRLFGLFEGLNLKIEPMEFYKVNKDGIYEKTELKNIENFEAPTPGSFPLVLIQLRKFT